MIVKRRKVWKVSKGTDITEYNEKLARKLRKIALHILRIAKHYGVFHVDLVVLGDYVSARAQEEEGTSTTTVVDDYMFTTQEDKYE